MTASTTFELGDLGLQIPYRSVFVLEYLGPVLIMAVLALRPAFAFGAAAAAKPWQPIATYAVAAWILHYVKRLLVSGALF